MSLDEPIPFRLCNYNSDKGLTKRTIKRLPRRKQTLRNNPQPLYVKHFYGLQNMPICRVVCTDRIKQINNQNSENTLTGLPILRLRELPPIERAVPKLGIVPINEPWRAELHALTESILENLSMQDACNRLTQYHPYPINRPVTGFAASTTFASLRSNISRSRSNLIGREKDQYYSRPSTSRSCSTLIDREKELNQSRPSTSRSIMSLPAKDRDMLKSRCSTSRSSIVDGLERLFWNESWESDYESQVLSLLGQVLGLISVDEVKLWLARASDRERASIIRILETVFQSKLQNNENIPPVTHLKPMQEEVEDELEENEASNEEEMHPENPYLTKEITEQQEIVKENYEEDQEHKPNLDRLVLDRLPPVENPNESKVVRSRTLPSKIRPKTCSATPMTNEMKPSESLFRPIVPAASSMHSDNNSQTTTVIKDKQPKIILRYKTANLNSRKKNFEKEFEY